jgi:predicted nucleic acid-binding protein
VRLVLDTNAAVSGLLWHGNPGKLIDAAQAGSLILCASAPLLAELHGVLGREKFAQHLQVRRLCHRADAIREVRHRSRHAIVVGEQCVDVTHLSHGAGALAAVHHHHSRTHAVHRAPGHWWLLHHA